MCVYVCEHLFAVIERHFRLVIASGWQVIVFVFYMLSNMSTKNAHLTSRPEPPSVEEIVEDIGRSQKNDVVFTLTHCSRNG